MVDAVETVRQSVKQKAAGELVGAEGGDLRLAVVAIILPPEGSVSDMLTRRELATATRMQRPSPPVRQTAFS